MFGLQAAAAAALALQRPRQEAAQQPVKDQTTQATQTLLIFIQRWSWSLFLTTLKNVSHVFQADASSSATGNIHCAFAETLDVEWN